MEKRIALLYEMTMMTDIEIIEVASQKAFLINFLNSILGNGRWTCWPFIKFFFL